jgi:hypothetical protein
MQKKLEPREHSHEKEEEKEKGDDANGAKLMFRVRQESSSVPGWEFVYFLLMLSVEYIDGNYMLLMVNMCHFGGLLGFRFT